MGSQRGVLILVGVALLQWAVPASSSCKGTDGRPGEAGLTGRDGWPGIRGDKGQSAPADVAAGPLLKGAKGKRGPQGLTGPMGYQGDPGEEGQSGAPGPTGSRGGDVNFARTVIHRSAFSVVRTLNTYPQNSQKVIFQDVIVNTPGDFSLSTGIFTCRVPGVYYFVFHAYSKVSMCLRLNSDALSPTPLEFCDYNSRETGQVLSGGGVLQLTRGKKVWMEGFMDHQPATVTTDTQEKKIIFNGFLVFSTS
ncbi:unnamed protein product [Boreogadus saida]